MGTRNMSRSLDHVNWWNPEHWKKREPRSVSSVSLEDADPAEIRNGWLTLPSAKARFQQKQMAEREMKIASLYEAQQTRALDKVRHSPSNGHVSNGNSVSSTPPQPPVPAVSHQPGKVRQMFEERRTKGIDKSYPLQPIHNTERTRKALPNGYSKVSTTSRVSVEKRAAKVTSTTHSVKKVVHHKSESIVLNGSGDLNHNHEPDLNSLKHALPQSNGEMIPTDELDKRDEDNNYKLEDETFPEALAPIPTPRSPDPVARPQPVRQEVKPPPRRSPPARSTPTKPKSQPAAPTPKRVLSENAVSETSKPRGAMQKSSQQKSQPVVKATPSSGTKPRSVGSPSASAAAAAGSAGAGDACAVCGRRFAPDRLAKHQDICKKAHAKKRKPFDALKHRLAGTEAEPFISKLRKGGTGTSTTSSAKVGKPLNSNWRQKHEEFINAIRAAKQVQAHLQAGGKLSDLPPPPPSENPDYVKCPSCGRRFNQAAAERHIPKCKDFQFNKPKPAASKRR